MSGQPQRQEHQPVPSMKGTRSELSMYFHTKVEDNILYAYHQPGCQLLDFRNAAKAPRQIEILSTLQVMWVNMKKVAGLQNAVML
ncbi:hypothetical protein ACJMK2_032097 [Sinanodonta woodiana]|uniref:Uncharacterized protein n=1 Tax=Sinanodonta woodiana TaxID=1069815 RepID=A0ABD3X0T9_SINWO